MDLFEYGKKLLEQREDGIGSGGKVNMVAIVTKRKKIISVGYNSYTKTHTMQARCAFHSGDDKNKIYLHAEIAAIITAKNKRQQPDSITVVRLLKNGKTGMAAPCKTCAKAIKDAGIKYVSHTI